MKIFIVLVLISSTVLILAGASPKPFDEFNETIIPTFSVVSPSPKPFDEFNEKIPIFSEAYVGHVFNKWIVKHGRNYSSRSEMIKRRQIFKKNLLYIQKFNSQGNNTYRLAINKFADMNEEDMPNCVQEEPNDLASEKLVSFNISGQYSPPKSFDWRDHKAVSPVRDQGTCGSCWAFAAVGAMESLFYIRGRVGAEMTVLSPQQLIDCDTTNHGCVSGLAQKAFVYSQGGIVAEVDYPYQGIKQSCDQKDEYTDRYYTNGYTAIHTDEWTLTIAVLHQPVAASICISDDFNYYDGGIYQGACGTGRHAVLIVGYGGNGGEDNYWILKNSWGTNWGMDGYFLMRRGQSADEFTGHCCLMTRLVYPTVLAGQD